MSIQPRRERECGIVGCGLAAVRSVAGDFLCEMHANLSQAAHEAAGSADLVNHPPHYCAGEIECIQAIRAALTPEEFRGFCKGNALAYLWRERHKGGDVDLRKAEWYIRKAAE